MALNYLVDSAMDSECVSSIQNNKSVYSTFGDIIISNVESIQTKRRHPTYYPSRQADTYRAPTEFQILILIQNATIGRKQDTHELTIYLEETTFQTKNGGRRRRRRRETMKRSTLNIVRDKTHGLVILIMSRDENDYNLMTNTTTYSPLRVNNKYI